MGSFIYPEGSRVVGIDADSFDSFIKTHERVFIHFGAEWNGYDFQLIPLVVAAANNLHGKVFFAFMDVDLKKNFDLFHDHRLYHIPYIQYYERGILLKACVGSEPAIELLQSLTTELGKP